MNVVLLAPPSARLARIAPAVAASLAVLTGCVAVALTPAVVAATLISWSGVVLVAAVVDMRTGRLPDVVVLPGIALVLSAAYLAGRLPGALCGALLFGLPVFVVHLARPEGLGFGDVKYVTLLGAGIGLVGVPFVLPAYLLAAVGHSAVCGVVRARGRLVPFGPSLAVGSILVVVAGLLWRL